MSYTSCLHGKRPCHQQDVNRRCIPSVTAAMTDDSKERFFTSILKSNNTLLPSTNGTLHKYSTHTNTVRVRFKLLNNEIVLPTDPNYSTQDENPRLASTDNIEGKLLIHPHTDLLCIVHRVYTVNNNVTINLLFDYTTALETVHLRRT